MKKIRSSRIRSRVGHRDSVGSRSFVGRKGSVGQRGSVERKGFVERKGSVEHRGSDSLAYVLSSLGTFSDSSLGICRSFWLDKRIWRGVDVCLEGSGKAGFAARPWREFRRGKLGGRGRERPWPEKSGREKGGQGPSLQVKSGEESGESCRQARSGEGGH